LVLHLVGFTYDDIHQKFKAILNKTVRASSIVECINSLIRPYLFLKKVVPDKFLDLLQFYFNTRKYRRSRKSERVGKSPVELLTGMKCPSVLSLLGRKAYTRLNFRYILSIENFCHFPL